MFGVSAVWDRRNEPFVSAEARRWMNDLGLGAEAMMLVQDANRAGGIKSPTSKSILFASPVRGELSIREQWDGLVNVHRSLTLDLWEPAEPPDYRKHFYLGKRPTIQDWRRAAEQAVAIQPDVVELFNERLPDEEVYADEVIRAVLPIFESAGISTLADHPLTTFQSKHIAVRREWDLETATAVARRALLDPRTVIDETWLGAMPRSSTWETEGADKYMAAVRESKRAGRRVNVFVCSLQRRKWGASFYETGLIDHDGSISPAGRLLEGILNAATDPDAVPTKDRQFMRIIEISGRIKRNKAKKKNLIRAAETGLSFQR